MSYSQPVAAEGGSNSTPPAPGSFELPPVYSAIGVTKPMLLARPLGGARLRVLLRRRAQAPRWCRAGCSSPARRSTASCATRMARDIIGSHDFMKFVPYLFTLFFFILVNNFFGVDPVHPVPDFSRIGFVYALALIELVASTTAPASGSTARSATSSSRRAGRRQGPDPAAARAAGVLLQHPRPPGHARAASVRQHVRRPPAADPVRHRRRVPPGQRQPALRRRSACWPWCSPSASLPRDAGAVPPGLRLHPPDAMYIARPSPTSTDPTTPQVSPNSGARTRRRRKEKPWTAPST